MDEWTKIKNRYRENLKRIERRETNKLTLACLSLGVLGFIVTCPLSYLGFEFVNTVTMVSVVFSSIGLGRLFVGGGHNHSPKNDKVKKKKFNPRGMHYGNVYPPPE